MIRSALSVLIFFTIVLGGVYPVMVTLMAHIFFPYQASGSLIRDGDAVIGSELLGQPFQEERYFWGRISATSPAPYNGTGGSGSNLAIGNPSLLARINSDIERLQRSNPGTGSIPVDLVTASASGLDPHISIAAARYQAKRVAQARGLAESAVLKLIDARSEERFLGVLGEPRINVLLLNLSLDRNSAG